MPDDLATLTVSCPHLVYDADGPDGPLVRRGLTCVLSMGHDGDHDMRRFVERWPDTA